MKRLAFVLLAACRHPAAKPVVAPKPTPATPAPKPEPVISDDERAKAFVGKLATSDFAGAAATFDDRMRGAMSTDQLAQLWIELQKQVGAFVSIESVELQPESGMQIASVKTAFVGKTLVLRVVYGPEHHVAGLSVALVPWQPPTYAKPDTFEERDVSLGNPALPGTLTIPKGAKNIPAIVLVHGSGPGNRDEQMGEISVFKDLAWGLASQGIAVLRYDKRTLVSPAGVRTQKEEVDDAAHAAIALLRAQPEIDASRIALLGHSQGGYLGPRIAKADPAIKRLVLLAGSAQPLEDSILMQGRYFKGLAPNEPKLDDMIAKGEAFKHAIANPKLKPTDDVANPFGGQPFPGSYFLEVRDYHPERVASKLTIPILVLQGERDYQVTMAADFAKWKAALGKAKNVSFKTYPALSHAFTAGQGPGTPADYNKPAHVDEQVVTDIAAFLTAK